MNRLQRAFHGKIVLITGASSGIGAWMAREFGRLGAVPVAVARSRDKLDALAQTLPERHKRIVADVTSDEQVRRFVSETIEQFGKIDLLINNAGFGVFERFSDASLDTLEEMMNVNYFGTVRCTKAVLPHMLAAGSGHIVNIASLAGKVGSAKASGYAATKHAVVGFSNSLRQELSGTGVKVTVINPGPIDTPFFDRADPSGRYVQSVRWMMLRPEQVGRAVMRAAAAGKAEVNLPFAAALAAKIYLLFPRLFDRIATQLLNRK